MRVLAALVGKIFATASVPKEVVGKLLKGFLIGVAVIAAVYFFLRAVGVSTDLVVSIFGVSTSFSIWSLVIILLFWFDGNIYIRKHELGLKDQRYAAAATVVALAVVGSVVFHEFAHGFVSQVIFGNPIDYAGMTGWGAFVAPHTSLFDEVPIQQVAVALAGPLANILLGYIALVFVWKQGESLLENSVQYVGVINFRLAKFNLIPFLLLLDGGTALHGLLRALGLTGTTLDWVTPVIGLILFAAYRVYRKVSGKPPIEEYLAKI